jgi:hypothetical protein
MPSADFKRPLDETSGWTKIVSKKLLAFLKQFWHSPAPVAQTSDKTTQTNTQNRGIPTT